MLNDADISTHNCHNRTAVQVSVYGGAELIEGAYSNADALVVGYRVYFHHDGRVTSYVNGTDNVTP